MLAVCWHILDFTSVCWPRVAPVLAYVLTSPRRQGSFSVVLRGKGARRGASGCRVGVECRAWGVGVQLKMSWRAECCVIYQVAM